MEAAAANIPLPYQHTGAEFLAARRYAGLFDDMGVGKTCQAVLAADKIGAETIVVLAPKIALVNWTREIAKWTRDNRALILTNPISASPIIGRPRWLLVNYDLVQTPTVTLKLLRSMRFDLLILDECQALKNHDARRTVNVYGDKGIGHNAKRVWALSGTPCPNHPGELYPMLRAMFPQPLMLPDSKALMSYQGFLNRYCVVVAGRFKDRVVGGRDLDRLRAELKPFALRRTMGEVLPDMPPLRFSTVTLDPENALAHLQDDGDLKRLRQLIDAAYIEAENPDSFDAHLMNTIEQITGDDNISISNIRRLFGQAKAPLVAEFLADELRGGLEKVVVFFHHTIVGEIIGAMLDQFGTQVVDGKVPHTWRQKFIDDFQDNPAFRVLLVQLDVGSTAISLTAAAHVVFAEPSWVPTTNVQAARRCARLGQTRAVLARFMVMAGSIDEIVMGVVARKTAMLARLFPDFGEPDNAA